MNKYIDFEDSVFILFLRVRMLRDLLRLNPDPELFLDKTMDDLQFINNTLETLMVDMIANAQIVGRNGEFDSLSDLEWQYNQLLTEFSGDSSPFSAENFPNTRETIFSLKNRSDIRRKTIDESVSPMEQAQAEPMVSPAELTGLLKGF
jgi:hypothetical protein